MLTEQAGAWLYQHNLGSGRFGRPQLVAVRPSLGGFAMGAQQLLDVDGDGQIELVSFSGHTPGYYERSPDAQFAAFRPFRSLPSCNWNDPNLRFADVTGDGLADILITEDDALTWHESLGAEGFAAAVRVSLSLDDDHGPRVMFADSAQSVFLADMSGDGSADIVRIRNGEVCFWPNLGYGRFGPKVTMDRSPRFDKRELFDSQRIRLADTDGSGTTDIIYFGADGVSIFLNESGNGWSEPRTIHHLPALTSQRSASVMDLLGRGTACLVWSSILPGDAGRPLLYIDLMSGRKPHLLTRIVNNLGTDTEIEYESSTRFFLADKVAGEPWVTQLPFPVHVVERIITLDHVSHNRFVTRYSYHHGHFDGVEREFRGFGRVDQYDTEEFAVRGEAAANELVAWRVPPVLTRSWFHTGAFLGGALISKHYAHEYYREGDPHNGESAIDRDDVEAMLLPDTTLPDGLDEDEARELCRALKGSLLRRETYGLDGSDAARQQFDGRPQRPH